MQARPVLHWTCWHAMMGPLLISCMPLWRLRCCAYSAGAGMVIILTYHMLHVRVLHFPCTPVLHACPAQPLFIQTPLQVMLETLVEKLQLQADAINGMQNRVSPACLVYTCDLLLDRCCTEQWPTSSCRGVEHHLAIVMQWCERFAQKQSIARATCKANQFNTLPACFHAGLFI